MPPTSTKKASVPSKTTTTPVVAEVAPAVLAPKAVKKTTVKVVADTVSVPAPVPEVVPEDKTVEKVGDNLLLSLVEKVNAVNSQMKEIQNLIKLVSKECDKQQKIIDKVQKKRQNAKNSPSGFAKPNKISNELCDFIGVAHGTEKSRTDITRFINAYVKEHNLNNPQNRRFIIPDVKLKAILNVKDGEEINYFILQKLISHHFPLSASKQLQQASAGTTTA